jgi:hypothetical protein
MIDRIFPAVLLGVFFSIDSVIVDWNNTNILGVNFRLAF